VPFVLDASVAANWLLADEHHRDAEVALDEIAHDSAIVPVHWWFEIRKILAIAERRGRASEQQTAQYLDRLAMLPIELSSLPDQYGVMTLARRRRLTFYDAAYLELAQRSNVSLATLDAKLAAAARAENVLLVGRQS
jgi:predicted nucleic acid-binding protein